VSDLEVQQKDWTASSAFKCIAVLIGISFLMNVSVRVAYEHKSALSDWLTVHSYGVDVSLQIIKAALWLITAFAFSRCHSTREFIGRAGWTEWPSQVGWLGSLVGVAIGLFGFFAITKGWMGSIPVAGRFYRNGGLAWLSFALYISLLGPFVEETVVRGFLFHAFRGRYSFPVSTILVLGFQMYFHWGLIIHGWLA